MLELRIRRTFLPDGTLGYEVPTTYSALLYKTRAEAGSEARFRGYSPEEVEAALEEADSFYEKTRMTYQRDLAGRSFLYFS